MSNREFHITDAASGTAIAVRIVPLARCDEIAGIEEDGTVKIRLMAAPVEGEMNEALSGFLAGLLGIDPQDVEIIAGLDSRKKLVTLTNVDTASVERLLHEAAGQAEP